MTDRRGGRGIVVAEVAGSSRRLRISLEAIEEVELATDQPFPVLASSLSDEQRVRFSHLLKMYEELCKAGGTPLSAEERSELLPSDLPEMVAAIRKACVAAGVIEEVSEEEAANAEGEDGKKKDRPNSPGSSGNGSPSDT